MKNIEGKSKSAPLLFSIIVPIYNVNTEYLEICMHSILQQTYSAFEVILVDDGSKKECAEACDKYAQADERVQVIHQRNNGVSSARNHGIEAASSEWILFVDADDWIEKNTLETLKKYLETIKCDILFFNAVREYARKQRKMNYGLTGETLYRTDDLETFEMFCRRAMGSPNTKEEKYCVIYYSCDKLYRRSFLTDNRLQYPVGIPKSEDKIFILNCFEKMPSVYYIDTVLYHYRINQESVCNRYSENAVNERMELVLKLKEIAERLDLKIGKEKNIIYYDEMNKQFYRFVFGIISDIFRLKFFHPDYPGDKKLRNAEVEKFLNTEPFYSAVRQVRYSELSNSVKIKKFMLTHKMASLFYKIKEIKRRISGNTAE